MSEDALNELAELRRTALDIFSYALAEVDARRAVRRALSVEGARLRVLNAEYDLSEQVSGVYVVAAGKAARMMAAAVDEVLGERIVRGVVSAPGSDVKLSGRWEEFAGGHPLPDEQSVEAARAAFRILAEADRGDALILFLISGGGSAMLEAPRAGVTLEELRETNRALVSCGAAIAEINCVRRALSEIKDGRLAARAPRAAQVTLVVSDVNAGRESDVASGPTFSPPTPDAADPLRVVEKYDLQPRLPAPILDALRRPARAAIAESARLHQRHFVLLDNRRAIEAAAHAARSRGLVVEAADDIVEQHVAEGVPALVSRLYDLYRREGVGGRGVCVVSGGEFACPVRGVGTGGRNVETALRCALEFERLSVEEQGGHTPQHVVALSAGTDGVDGNSPAAGALADDTTPRRARSQGLDPCKFLDESDAHTFFRDLGDAITTGPTGTNVRDLRILMAT